MYILAVCVQAVLARNGHECLRLRRSHSTAPLRSGRAPRLHQVPRRHLQGASIADRQVRLPNSTKIPLLNSKITYFAGGTTHRSPKPSNLSTKTFRSTWSVLSTPTLTDRSKYCCPSLNETTYSCENNAHILHIMSTDVAYSLNSKIIFRELEVRYLVVASSLLMILIISHRWRSPLFSCLKKEKNK